MTLQTLDAVQKVRWHGPVHTTAALEFYCWIMVCPETAASVQMTTIPYSTASLYKSYSLEFKSIQPFFRLYVEL